MTIRDPFSFQTGSLPLLISIPHAGTQLTPAVEAGLTDDARPLPDTDWHIPQLYDFARAMGASVLVGNYSRFVIDLNRPADDKPLYTTATTGLYPDVLFDGRPSFLPGKAPTDEERAGYLQQIWQPYHQQLQDELARLKARHGYALLFDAHSIASVIPRLFDGKLPDLNLGTNGGESCAQALSDRLVACCEQQQQYTHVLNGRFKGGYITRAYGQPQQQHAIQLELAQVNYMSEQYPFAFEPQRAASLQRLLKQMIEGLLDSAGSANVGEKGDVAVFFGLSGTGKTTLSTDPKRQLIGDDEHGWDDDGVFNFEGGCYAKTIKLSPQAEPEIYQAIRRDALLENVTVLADGSIDFDDASKTENTRVSYPIYHIENIVKPVSKAGHARKIIFLTADAFGVLPPVSRLTPEQTQYHFLSGFTAKLAGTERGITAPTPTFSACFGAAFLTLHPTQYAEVLVKRMEAAGAQAYLVNTGWNGSGKRISIKDTRGIIDAILNGDIEQADTFTLPIFGLAVPTALPGVDPSILDPRKTYADESLWQEKAQDLAQRFIDNFAKYTVTQAGEKLVNAGPKL